MRWPRSAPISSSSHAEECDSLRTFMSHGLSLWRLATVSKREESSTRPRKVHGSGTKPNQRSDARRKYCLRVTPEGRQAPSVCEASRDPRRQRGVPAESVTFCSRSVTINSRPREAPKASTPMGNPKPVRTKMDIHRWAIGQEQTLTRTRRRHRLIQRSANLLQGGAARTDSRRLVLGVA